VEHVVGDLCFAYFGGVEAAQKQAEAAQKQAETSAAHWTFHTGSNLSNFVSSGESAKGPGMVRSPAMVSAAVME